MIISGTETRAVNVEVTLKDAVESIRKALLLKAGMPPKVALLDGKHFEFETIDGYSRYPLVLDGGQVQLVKALDLIRDWALTPTAK